MYKIQKGSAFYATLTFLMYFGQVPGEFEESYSIFFLLMVYFINLGSVLIICIGPVVHIIVAYRDNIAVDKSETLSVAVSTTGSVLTLVFLSMKYKTWLKLFEDITDHETFGTPGDYDMIVKRYNRLSTIYSIYRTSAGLIYAISGQINPPSCDERDLRRGYFCRSFTPLWLPVDATDMKLRVLVYILQMYLGLNSAIASGAVNFMIFEATELLIAHVDDLKKHFASVFEEPQRVSERLKFCIQYQIHLISMANTLGKLFKHTSGHMTLISGIIFGSIGNQMIKSYSVGATLYLIGYMGAMFFICHAGQRIKDKLMSVGDALYNAEWHLADTETIKDAMFIIARSQIPFNYEALPFGGVDYALFIMILKTSYSYITLLSQST